MMYLILLVLLIIFFSTIGFKLIINTSIWLSGFSRDDSMSTSSRNDSSFLLAPELFDVPDATNSAEIRVSGQGTRGTKLTIYVNDASVDSFELEEDEFEATIPLDEGTNAIYLEIQDKKNKRAKDSEIYTVVVLHDKPSLSVTSPSDGETVSKESVTVSGKTDENVSVRINNFPVVVSSDGSFRRSMILKEGDNTLVIVAEDIAGNTEQIELKVRYERD
jgi:bacillopeptidase F